MEISINIIRAVNNNKYVNMKDYYELAFNVKRIWLSEPCNIIFEKNRIYSIKLKSDEVIEGSIIQIGQDEFGFYIVFKRAIVPSQKGELLNNSVFFERQRIPKGYAVLKEVFAPDTIAGGKELIQYCEGQWPNLNGSALSIKKEGSNYIFHLMKGNLGETAVELRLCNVYAEKCIGDDCNNLEYFDKEGIGYLDIKKLDDFNYTIHIQNNFMEFICIDELTYNSVEHRNEVTINCRELNITYYNSFLRGLEEKGIALTKLYSDKDVHYSKADELRSKWLETFTRNIDVSDANLDQCLWHIFSYGKLSCVQREDADAALIKIKKETLYLFFNEGTTCYRLNNAEKFTAENIDYFNDIYVTNEDFTWTYALTHERVTCGPYFHSN
ncbi:DUF4275 family protein [Clostridium sp. FP1]|uniref:DUF4275 family protein n=1 Tax=Clostridium sp. FP1 TaxID=2724076 RepID=UPI0013E9442A|nr:DUF4275 family protein [Clostridium sp. FP1]MBZ9634096.1 DUF4275 family protein [Clostridium sp. FP1]